MQRNMVIHFAWSSLKLAVLFAGSVATVALAMLGSDKPLVRVARVDGVSMAPTLRAGEELLFARKPWHVGDIVLANVQDTEPVVKRIVATVPGSAIILAGDNRGVSEIYSVHPADLLGVCIARSVVKLPSLAKEPPPEM